MKKVILYKVNVRSFFRDAKLRAAEETINRYINENNLNVASVSLFKENDDEYLFTLTCE
jgi:hypothetical protein